MTFRLSSESILNNSWIPRNQTYRGVQSLHLWIIISLTVLCIIAYYAEQITLIVGIPKLSHGLFTTLHDVQGIQFSIPLIYTSLFFRVRGSLIVSFICLCTILSHNLLGSSYPDTLLRPVVLIIIITLTSLLIATQLNWIERERRSNTELSKAYHKLSEAHNQLEESREQLIQTEKLTLLGQMAASIAHEAKNPISAAVVLVRLLSKEISKDSLSKKTALEHLAKLESALTYSSSLMHNVLDFSRKSASRFDLCGINDVIEKAFELTVLSTKGLNIEVVKELAPALPKVMADFSQLQQVFVNLFLNAIQSMPQGGTLTIRSATDGDWIKTEVQDTGYGISPDNMKKLFTPFFTTKEKGEGVGLGLVVCSEIVCRHQGRIEVHSEDGHGTTFTVHLPIYIETDEENIPELESRKGKAKVLANVTVF